MKMETTELKICGMICRSCVGEVEEMLLHTRGVICAKVSYVKSLAQIEYDPELTSLETIRERLRTAGYETGDRGMSALAVDGLCVLLTCLLVWILLGGSKHPMLEPPADAVYGAAFLVGLLQSPHCIGMCGGILLGQSAPSASPIKVALAYNGGRVAAYTVIGAVFGALGTGITYSMSVKSMVFTMVGLAVAVIGLNMWGLLPGLRALFPEQTACRLPLSARKNFAGRPWMIGILTGLMPCGSLYAMWLHAISGGSAGYGAMSMLSFALGTVPLMLLFGALGELFPRRWNKYLLKASAVLVTAMGLKMLVMGLRML